MKKFLLLTLLTIPAFAKEGYWCPAEPKVVRFPRPQGECYQVDTDTFNPETAAVSNGQLVVDAAKLAAYNAKIAAEQTARSDKAAKIAACEALYADVDNAVTLVQLKAILKCVVKDAR